ncbi:MAG: hypothetical protein KC619_33860 [Myxococcales bacterium]|nr:hypothetical protein [Myxococcales bacterium]
MAGCAAEDASPEAPEDGPPLPLGPDGKLDGVSIDAYGPLPAEASFEAPLAALFAPDDPVVTVELAEIQTVRDARALDPNDYAEGENPFRIRYAVYNLRNPEIVDALADAADEGVDVQILIDADQLDPARDYNVADEALVARGFELVTDHRDLDDTTRRTADLIGIDTSGLMHLKTRIYETPDHAAVLTGSFNPGDNAVLNEETFHLIRDPALIARYTAAYESVLRGARIANTWDDAAAVNVLFTPSASGPRAGGRLLSWIEEEDELILLMVFSLRDITGEGHDRSLVEALGARAAAGVPVYVITDRKQSDGVDANGQPLYANDGTEDRLRAAGVHVYEATNRRTEFTAMHHKVGIFGLTSIRVVTDAANWTFSGLGSSTRVARNYESQLFIDSARLDDGRTGRRYLAQWLRVLERYADESASDGEPSFAEVAATLQGLAGWPTQGVGFTATAETSFGESIYVRGDAPSLGAWDGLGLPLETDGMRYPVWTSPATIALPLGATVEWKLTASYGDAASVRWERGPNRRAFVQPAALVASDALSLNGEWR